MFDSPAHDLVEDQRDRPAVHGPVAAKVEPAERHPAHGVPLVLLAEVDHWHQGLGPARQVDTPGDLAFLVHGVRAEPDGQVDEGA